MNPQKNKSPDSQEIRKDRAILGLAQHSSADAVVEAERVLRQARLEAFLCSMARLQHAASTAVATLQRERVQGTFNDFFIFTCRSFSVTLTSAPAPSITSAMNKMLQHKCY